MQFFAPKGVIFIKFLTLSLRRIGHKLWLLALIAVNVAILTYIILSAMPALYGAEAHVLVTGSDEAAENYVRIVSSRAVCNRLIEEFGLTSPVDTILSSLRVEKLDGTTCLSVRVLCQDPETSRILTDALVRYSSEIMTQLYEGTSTFVYNEPLLPTEPYGADPLYLSLIAFAAAWVIGSIFACFPLFKGCYLIDKKSTEELLGLPVLGVIPGEKDRNGGNS